MTVTAADEAPAGSIEPYYADEAVTLYCGDWRSVLPKDGWADVIVTDPPYGQTNLEWDQWVTGWPSLAARHTNSLWCFGSMRMFLDRLPDFNGWRFAQDVVWEKHNGSRLAKDRFNRVHELALHWYRGPWRQVYSNPPTTNDSAKRTVRRKARPAHWTGATGAAVYVSEDGGPRLTRSVMRAASLHGRAVNETQKPVLVVEALIRSSCPPGGIVWDVFAGSGTTGVAAKLAGRRAVLVEKREQQCEAAVERLRQCPLVVDQALDDLVDGQMELIGGDRR